MLQHQHFSFLGHFLCRASVAQSCGCPLRSTDSQLWFCRFLARVLNRLQHPLKIHIRNSASQPNCNTIAKYSPMNVQGVPKMTPCAVLPIFL